MGQTESMCRFRGCRYKKNKKGEDKNIISGNLFYIKQKMYLEH